MSVCAPPGVGPSATVESPPPTFKPPQPSALRTVPPVPPLLTEPQVPVGSPVVNTKMVGTVVDVVVVVGTVVVEVDVLVGGADVLVVVDSTVVVEVEVVTTVVEVEVVEGGVVVLVVLTTGQLE